MSNLREKAREIKAAGERDRGNFEPDGVPLKMYNYWLEQSGSKKAAEIKYGKRKENFCHFWRVVAIWAPLFALANAGEKVITSPITWIAIVLTLVGGVVFGSFTSGEFLEIVLWTLAAFAALVATGVSIWAAASALQDKSQRDYAHNDYLPTKWLWLGILNPPMFALVYGIGWLCKKELDGIFLGGLAIAAVAFVLVGSIITEGWLATLIAVGVFIGGLVALGAIFVGLASLGEWIKSVRAHNREKRREALRNRPITASVEREPREPREPGFISKFFSGIGDFLVLLSQVVRVNKWKICPIVTVDTKKEF